MDRAQFILATTVILFVAFGLGWFAYWLLHRFSRVSQAEVGELDRLAQALLDAEETREQTIAYIEEREAELTSRVLQAEAELRAAMEGLRDARTEASELRAYIERMNAG